MFKCCIDKMKNLNKSAIADVYKLKLSLMDKKQYVLKVLDLLKDSMPLARWFMVLIQNTDVDEELLDTLIHAFQESLKDIQDEELKNKLEKWKTFLETLKQKEIQSQNLDQEDIKHLDELLANM